MASAISATSLPRARPMPIWRAAMPKSSSTSFAATAAPPPPPPPTPPGLLRLDPFSEGLRERIWWGAASTPTVQWAAKMGMNLQSSTLVFDETGKPFHIQQAEQIRAYKAAWKEAGHPRTPRVSVSRSIFPLVNDLDQTYFGRGASEDHFGYIEPTKRAAFGRSYADTPDNLIE